MWGDERQRCVSHGGRARAQTGPDSERCPERPPRQRFIDPREAIPGRVVEAYLNAGGSEDQAAEPHREVVQLIARPIVEANARLAGWRDREEVKAGESHFLDAATVLGSEGRPLAEFERYVKRAVHDEVEQKLDEWHKANAR